MEAHHRGHKVNHVPLAQISISLSTIEAESISCSAGVQEAIRLWQFLEDLGIRKDDEGPMIV